MGIWNEIKVIILDAINSDPDYRRQQKLREKKTEKTEKPLSTKTENYTRKNLDLIDEFNINEKK